VVTEGVAKAVAEEAVFNALTEAKQAGFDHGHSDALSLIVDYVEATDYDSTV
jgi:hypothetical protein